MVEEQCPCGPEVACYLLSNNCAEHIKWLEKAFKDIHLEVAEKFPTPCGSYIMHVSLKMDGGNMYLSDALTCGKDNSMKLDEKIRGEKPNDHYMVSITVKEDVATTFFQNALDAGAKEEMKFGNAFWGGSYGQFRDPFGFVYSITSSYRFPEKSE